MIWLLCAAWAWALLLLLVDAFRPCLAATCPPVVPPIPQLLEGSARWLLLTGAPCASLPDIRELDGEMQEVAERLLLDFGPRLQIPRPEPASRPEGGAALP